MPAMQPFRLVKEITKNELNICIDA